MDAIKITIGLLLMAAGFVFFYAPELVYRINRITREYLFNDRNVLLFHKKIAVLLISTSLIVLYMGFFLLPSLSQKTEAIDPITAAKIDALNLYSDANYRASLRSTYWVLSQKPKDKWALIHAAHVHEMLNEPERAVRLWERVLSIYPDSKMARRALSPTGLAPNAKNKRKN